MKRQENGGQKDGESYFLVPIFLSYFFFAVDALLPRSSQRAEVRRLFMRVISLEQPVQRRLLFIMPMFRPAQFFCQILACAIWLTALQAAEVLPHRQDTPPNPPRSPEQRP